MSDPVILLDNIVFELQEVGGISKIWNKKIKYLESNMKGKVKYLEGKNVKDNIFRRELELSNLNIVPDKNLPLIIRRYTQVKTEEKGVFHSSYFRVTTSNKNMKNIVTVHDCSYENFAVGLKKKVHIWQKLFALKNADRIFCVSNNTKKELLFFYPWLNEEKIDVVPNGVDDDFYSIKDLPNRIIINNQEIKKNNFILYVGGRNYHKNFFSIFHLLDTESFKDLKLEIIIVGGSKLSNSEKKEIYKLRGSDKVKFINLVSNHDLNLLYNMAYCFVFPSIYEGFGIPVLEAMQAGCPVLSSNIPSLVEVIGHGGLFFSPNDYTEMKTKFNKLTDDDFKKEKINYGLSRSKDFSWKKTFDKVASLYEQLLYS